MNWSKLDLAVLLRQSRSAFAKLWSTVDFASNERVEFARAQMESETRSGVRTLAALFMLPLLGTALFSSHLGLGREYLYGFLALAGLSGHIYLSSRAVHDIEALYLLGMVLLVVSGTTFVLIAHRTGALGSVIIASVGLLFMAIPMVPWGLREGSIVAAMIYGLFTASIWSVADRFPSDTLWTFQMFMAASALLSTTVVARTALVRKRDITFRFDLELARAELETLSMEDSLTGVWNRRFLEAEFLEWSQSDAREDGRIHFALVDLGKFKSLNDRFGHTYGDQALVWVARALEHATGETGFVARVGGDEFACLIVADDAREQIDRAAEALNQTFRAAGEPDREVPTFSVGIVRLPTDRDCELAEVYKAADNALYEAKHQRGEALGVASVVTLRLGARDAQRSP